MANHNQSPKTGSHNILKRALLVGALVVAGTVAIARNFIGETSNTAPQGTVTTQQLDHRYGDVSIVGTQSPNVEVAEGFTTGSRSIDYWVSQDGGADWSQVTNAGHGDLLDVQVASNDEFGYGSEGVVALTTIDRQGDLRVGVDVLDGHGVTAVGQETINNATTQQIAGDYGLEGPNIQGQEFGYGEYNVDGGVSTRADMYTEQLSTKTGTVIVNVPLAGAPIIPGTQI